ncbi:hypothetical protein T484DRAFT_1862231 [Baffinella frigidus]|nr:hypothetical protein T484DRAFT_1862231 [Cryptophyta sp. CCMP2293]
MLLNILGMVIDPMLRHLDLQHNAEQWSTDAVRGRGYGKRSWNVPVFDAKNFSPTVWK